MQIAWRCSWERSLGEELQQELMIMIHFMCLFKADYLMDGNLFEKFLKIHPQYHSTIDEIW